MNGCTPPVIFDYETWLEMFPVFEPVSEPRAKTYFMRATNICANSCSNPIFNSGNLECLLYLLTAHIAEISKRDPTVVGRISSATEGSVTAQTELENPGASSALDADLSQTSYGLEYLAATVQYRTARYMARPTIVVNGAYPGIFSPTFGSLRRW